MDARDDSLIGQLRIGMFYLVMLCLTLVSLRAFGEEIVVEPVVSKLRCMTSPGRDALVYPGDAANVREGSILRLRMTFSSRDEPPKVDVFYDTAGGDFRRLVLAFVDGYRLPCLEPGSAPIIATQEFEFRSRDGRQVALGNVRDVPNVPRPNCFKPGPPPSFPKLRSNPYGSLTTQAVVLARMTFEAKDMPPRVEIVFNSGSRDFEDVVRDNVAGYRYLCEVGVTSGVHVERRFTFAMDGDRQVALKDSTLAEFVGALDKLDEQKVRFDFTTMNCPFSVSLEYRRPYTENAVRVSGFPDPNRREFLEWLKRVEFRGSRENLKLIVGKSMKVSIPCGTMDLT